MYMIRVLQSVWTLDSVDGQCGSCTVQCGDDGPEPWEEKSVRGNSPSHQPHHYSHHTALPSPHCHAMLSHCNFGKGSAVTQVEWASNRITERCFCCTGVNCGSSSLNKDMFLRKPIPLSMFQFHTAPGGSWSVSLACLLSW